jgi:hypothetical protein
MHVARFRRLLPLLAVCVAGASGLRAARADEAWERRILRAIVKAEVETQALDGQEAVEGGMRERIHALDLRVQALERAAEKPAGEETLYEGSSQTDLLVSLTGAITSIDARLRRLRKPPTPPEDERPESSDDPAGGVPAPETDPQGTADRGGWPERLRFNATAIVQVEESGKWIYGETFDHVVIRLGWLQDGHDGKLSVSLRAVGLVKEIRSARVLVVVHPIRPFRFGVAQTYRLEWTAERRMFNNATRTWAKFADWSWHPGPVWTDGPEKPTTVRPAVEAWVESVVTKDGDEVHFEVGSD